jgi:hypothetical protein
MTFQPIKYQQLIQFFIKAQQRAILLRQSYFNKSQLINNMRFNSASNDLLFLLEPFKYGIHAHNPRAVLIGNHMFNVN